MGSFLQLLAKGGACCLATTKIMYLQGGWFARKLSQKICLATLGENCDPGWVPILP